MKETIDDILTELSCKGWQEAVHEIEKALEEKDKEIERLNNIINEIEKDIKNLYTYGIKNNREQKDYLLNRLEGLKALKGVDKE